MARIAVVYYSSTGSNHRLAEAFVAGASEAGAEVRLRRIAETAPAEVIERNSAWAEHLEATKDIETATPDDLAWADGFVIGGPARFGQPSAQLKQFIDTTSGVWSAGQLVGKPATGFTSTNERHGGQESTLLAMYQTLFHWGALIVPTGYADFSISHAAGGNPYGVSAIVGDAPPNDDVLALAKYQGGRIARIASQLADN